MPSASSHAQKSRFRAQLSELYRSKKKAASALSEMHAAKHKGECVYVVIYFLSIMHVISRRYCESVTINIHYCLAICLYSTLTAHSTICTTHYTLHTTGVFDASAFRTAAAFPESPLLLNTLLDADLTDKDSNNLVLVSGAVCWLLCNAYKSCIKHSHCKTFDDFVHDSTFFCSFFKMSS